MPHVAISKSAVSKSASWRQALCALALFAVAVLSRPADALAQSVFPTAGLWVEAEGQRVLGDSSFEAGMVPPSFFANTGPMRDLDEGDGAGGAAALGFAWGNGWSAALRFRRLEADSDGGPIDPGLITYGAGVAVLPGGFPIGVLGAMWDIESETSIANLEVGKTFALPAGHVQLFGGVAYVSIERDATFTDMGCGCIPFSHTMSHDFHGVGPQVGFRGAIPLNGVFSLVGGGSVAALFGTSTYASYLDDPLSPSFRFKDEDERTVAALDGHAGVAVAIGIGTLTLGYRVDAVLDALDTDQRVSELWLGVGIPAIGDTETDFVEHGPFARFTLPLQGMAN